MGYTVEDIKKILRGYNKLKIKEKQLEFEISNVKNIKDEEIIESMTFLKNFDLNMPRGTTIISDKTARIAITYENNKSNIKAKNLEEIKKELSEVQEEIKRIIFYVDLLDTKFRDVIYMIFIEGNTINETAEKLNIAIVTVNRYVRKGLDNLVEMYNRLLN